MKVEYTLNRADWLAYFAHSAGKGKPPLPFLGQSLRLIFYVFCMVMALTAGAALMLFLSRWIFGLIDPQLAPWISILGTVVFALVAPIILALVLPRQYAAEARRIHVRLFDRGLKNGTVNPGMQYELTLVNDGLRLVTVTEQLALGVEFVTNYVIRAKWSAIDTVDISETHVFICVNTTTWMWVPRRAFADQTAWVEFLDTLQRSRDSGALLPPVKPEQPATEDKATTAFRTNPP